MSDPKRVAVVGVTGYAGFELATLLLRHPGIAKPTFYLRESARQAGELPDGYLSAASRLGRGALPAVIDRGDRQQRRRAWRFFRRRTRLRPNWRRNCWPPGLRVVDLSGAFRFRDPQTFESWYRLPAPDADAAGRGGLRPAGTLWRRACRRRGWWPIPAVIRPP